MAMSNFRFHCRVKIFPGLAVNLSKSGASFTVGVRGANVTVGKGRLTRIAGRHAESLSAFPLDAHSRSNRAGRRRAGNFGAPL